MNNINNGINERIGLITQDALRQLKIDISVELSSFESNKVSRSWKFKAIDPSNQNALVVWPTLCIALLYGCALYLSFCVSNFDKIDYFLPVEATILWILVFLNLYLVFNEDRLSKNEIPRRIKHSLDELERAARECNWKESNYPHLCAPCSPCLTLQWTYRDGKVVNLPWALLVRGDIIVMRPGQESPARCESIEDARMIMLPRQIYQPFTTGRETFTAPRVTQPHKNRLFKLTETPYISNLKLTLDKALCRPVTVHNKQRHLVMIRCIETFALPVTMFIAFLAITTRHFYLDHLVGTSHWSKAFLLQIVATTLPLLPTVFPVVWTALNIYGMSKFKHLLQSSTRYPLNKSTSLSEGMSNPLLQRSVEDGLAASDTKLWKTFVNILLGRENFVTRSANIVQVLGSVTALCCVDKKGILSWPNPTAEKVFFLRNSSSISRSSSKTSFSDSASHISNGNNAESSHGDNFNKQYTSLNTINHLHPTTVAEVLDLTHDQNVPFQLEFDDQSWKNHISCLKPLGLAILVNTCNMDTQEHYSHFCAHLTCEATQSEDAVPVTNRRCLCELAKQIGFVEEAKSVYSLQNHLATFRHLQPDVIRRDTRFARSLHLSTRVKVPLPHMLGVIMKDQAGGLQLMTQGTADIILDSCVEYWNGQDLCVLSPSDRKKVQDFYQRSSLTAYCSAFAYRPLTRGVSPQLSNLFLELPADCRSLYPPSVSWNEPQPPLTNHYHSTDSLLFSDIKDEDVTDVEGCFDVQCNQVFIGMVTMQYQAQSDMVELIERLDRACIRFVHFSKENELRSRVFSEKMGLESGWNCHISLSSDTNRPASPATSQTFPTPSCSEKAWKSNQTNFEAKAPHTKATNERGDSCGEDGIIFAHSSLESSRQLSNSAPGAINLDHPTVKFDNETSHVRYNKRNDSVVSQNNAANQENPIEGCESQDSVLLGGWEEADGSPADGCRSLSCLTDSTDHSAPVNFDMRNRAKLPRGIDNIRPHIEQVDNVPLLVSLFTDCTANTACRMIAIMQEYNEVVCVMGSAANKDNMEIFMQADASVAVEPLYPVLCQKVPPYELPEKGIGPIDLARTLNSIPCSISMARDADVSLFSLVTMARHFMLCLWSSAQFWLSASCSLTLLQLLSILLVLPMILTVGQVLWLCVVVIPAISVSLVFSPVDPEVMTKATNKHQGIINLRMSLFVMWCYGYKFLPSIVIVLVSYITLLTNFCNQIVTSNNATECIMMYPAMKTIESYNSSNLQSATQFDETGSNLSTDGVKDYMKMEWGSWGDVHIEGYIIAQQISFTLMSLLIITISISFVHREYSLWQKNVWSNKIWLTCVIILTSLQCIYSCLVLFLPTSSGNIFHNSFLFRLTLPHIITTVMAPLFILSTNEFIKWQEIKANLRYQRRARLDFGTKLGMNSPF